MPIREQLLSVLVYNDNDNDNEEDMIVDLNIVFYNNY